MPLVSSQAVALGSRRILGHGCCCRRRPLREHAFKAASLVGAHGNKVRLVPQSLVLDILEPPLDGLRGNLLEGRLHLRSFQLRRSKLFDQLRRLCLQVGERDGLCGLCGLLRAHTLEHLDRGLTLGVELILCRAQLDLEAGALLLHLQLRLLVARSVLLIM